MELEGNPVTKEKSYSAKVFEMFSSLIALDNKNREGEEIEEDDDDDEDEDEDDEEGDEDGEDDDEERPKKKPAYEEEEEDDDDDEGEGGDDDDDEDDDLSDNEVVKFASSIVKSTKAYDGDNFFTTVDGVRRATPLLLVVVCVELSDVLFAVDSIPAIFGVTEDPFIIFTSNIFAILGLRALFQVVAKLMENLAYLEQAVAIVLGFVGVKMMAEFGGVEISEEAALAVVVSVLGAGVAASLVKNSQEGA
uniref:Uncharacterized protein n=1 Tax=Hemiselmis tepida TaxID=464990 RepID=A0A7S0W8F8_9CRYP